MLDYFIVAQICVSNNKNIRKQFHLFKCQHSTILYTNQYIVSNILYIKQDNEYIQDTIT